VQQGLISKAIDGRGSGDVASRLDHLLTGEGRVLADRVLSPEQRTGLEIYRRGLQQAEAARTSVPGWVEDLARTGFDPNAVVSGLFGAGIPGAKTGSAEYGRTLKRALGEQSAEWANLRQAAWLRLTGQGEAQRIPAAREAERIRAFADGEGSGLARTLFSPDELALMNRYADAVRATHVPNGSRLPDGGRSGALARQVMNLISGAIGYKLAGPGGGALAYGMRMGQRALDGGLDAMRASRSFEGGAPRVVPPLPVPPPALTAGAGAAGGLIRPFGALPQF
jgi:hypothetical protein